MSHIRSKKYNRKQDLQTRLEKRVRERLNFRRRHKLPDTARKQIIFSVHGVCAVKGQRGETAAAYVFLRAHGGPPAAACSGGLEFPYSDPAEMHPGNSRRRIRGEKSVKTRRRESVGGSSANHSRVENSPFLRSVHVKRKRLKQELSLRNCVYFGSDSGNGRNREQQMPEKRRFGDSRSRATGTSENAKNLPSLSPFLENRDRRQFENPKRLRQLNIRRSEKNSLFKSIKIHQSNILEYKKIEESGIKKKITLK
ncbi:hypothetical protein ALC62_06474 [Cyphomyrmex costatus]|uniref:Uncharacterized protein n=1 Tax=Cyphomyrmex costatus TaxID=456900 RepID=A0A195CRD8_9HYME|nr:hypothetical protein ALC62_06474 [Cyphomyrmex costatus]